MEMSTTPTASSTEKAVTNQDRDSVVGRGSRTNVRIPELHDLDGRTSVFFYG